MLAALQRRPGGPAAAGLRIARSPAAGRHAELLRFASAVGNRRMAMIARTNGEHDEEEDEEEAVLSPGLDLSFLNAAPTQRAAVGTIAPPQAHHATVTPAPAAQQAVVTQLPQAQHATIMGEIPAASPQQSSITPAPVAQQSAVTDLPRPQRAVVHAAPQPPAAVAPVVPAAAPGVPAVAPVVPAAAPNRLAELNGLDQEREIKRLTRKVDELLQANQITVTASAPYRLGNPRKPDDIRGMVTIEVLFTVKAKTGGATLVQFVAHYHPGAEKASVGAAASSQLHIKKWANADKFNRDEDVKHTTHPNLNKLIPKFGPTVKDWKKLPVSWGLRKP
jgi:hypothetical protein